MRILGIDPGSRITGFGVIDANGDAAESVRHGVIKTGGGEFPERLGVIFSDLCDVIIKEDTGVVQVRNKGGLSVFREKQTRGDVRRLCAALGIELNESEVE